METKIYTVSRRAPTPKNMQNILAGCSCCLSPLQHPPNFCFHLVLPHQLQSSPLTSSTLNTFPHLRLPYLHLSPLTSSKTITLLSPETTTLLSPHHPHPKIIYLRNKYSGSVMPKDPDAHHSPSSTTNSSN